MCVPKPIPDYSKCRYSDVGIAYSHHRNDKNHDSHIFLYSKCHYIVAPDSNVWEDLRWVVAVRNLIEPKYISNTDILSVVGDIASPFLTERPDQIIDFMMKLRPSCTFNYHLNDFDSDHEYETSYDNCLLAGFLHVLRLTKVYERSTDTTLIELDPPDPYLLPTDARCLNGKTHDWSDDFTLCVNCGQPNYKQKKSLIKNIITYRSIYSIDMRSGRCSHDFIQKV